MNTHFLSKAVLGAACLAMASQAGAQNLRGDRTLYVMPHIGFSTYVGDNDAYPWDFGYWEDGTKELPIYGGLQIGYQFTPSVALGFGGAYGNYPTLFGDGTGENNHTKRFLGNALLRFTAGANTARFAPYIELGAAVNNGETVARGDGDRRFAYGPLAGIGFDVNMGRHTSLMLGGNLGFMLPDENTDASDLTGEDKFASFDLLGGFGVGLKYNFRPAFTPVMVIAIDGPSTLETNQTGTFTATVNNATEPVEYRWDFGDGSTGMGLTSTHAYSRAGTYTVTFTASNNGSMDSKSMSVTVTNPPVPAGVVSLASTPSAARVCLNQPVSFSSSARGDAPVNASWNFGDGSTGTGMTPSHTYTRTGTYTVSLNVSNASGSDARTLSVNVVDCTPPPVVATCNLTELNSAFFETNSSTLTTAGREALRQNIEAIRSQPGCAGTRVRVEGYAGPGERNAQQLSEDRARAVSQFYADNGLTNTSPMGMGIVGESTGKKDDTSQFRRVDSIPQR